MQQPTTNQTVFLSTTTLNGKNIPIFERSFVYQSSFLFTSCPYYIRNENFSSLQTIVPTTRINLYFYSTAMLLQPLLFMLLLILVLLQHCKLFMPNNTQLFFYNNTQLRGFIRYYKYHSMDVALVCTVQCTASLLQHSTSTAPSERQLVLTIRGNLAECKYVTTTMLLLLLPLLLLLLLLQQLLLLLVLLLLLLLILYHIQYGVYCDIHQHSQYSIMLEHFRRVVVVLHILY